MTIMILITGLGMGGAEHMLLKTLPYLHQSFVVVSLTTQDTLAPALRQKGIPVHILNARHPLKSLFQFSRLVRQYKPTLLHTYLIHADLYGRILGRLFGIKTIICSPRNKLINRKILLAIDRLTRNLVDKYTPNSKSVARFIHERIGVPQHKIYTIENGIDTSKFATRPAHAKRKELGIHPDAYVITCNASFKKQKNHSTLITSIQPFIIQQPNTRIILIGDGPLRDELNTLSKKLAIQDHIMMLGDQRTDIPELLRITDLFILPSTHEGMSNALLEAMAASKPIIISNIEENKELVRPDKECLTFDPHSPSQLTRCIERMHSNPHLAQSLGAAARAKAAHYHIDKTIKKLNKLYEEYEL